MPPEFMAPLRRSLSADPAARPQTAAAFRDALIGLDARPSAYVPPSPDARLAQYARVARHAGSGRYAAGLPPGQDPASGSANGPGTGPVQPSSGPVQSRSRTVWLIGVAGALVIIGAAVLIGVRLFPHDTTAGGSTAADRQVGTSQPGTSPGTGGQADGPAPVGAFGVATVRTGCPAASVRLAAARCPAVPECWTGLVEISGAVSAEPLPCSQPHDWETFVIAIMPTDAQTFDQPTLAENPTVRAVCSMPVLLASRRATARQIPARSWQIEVLPPTEAAFDSGTRTFRCVASVVGTQSSTSQFRR